VAASCAVCGGSLAGMRSSARYCSEKCRKRGKRRPADVVSMPDMQAPALLEAVRRELVAAGRESSALGVAALALAAQIDAAPRADLVKEFRATLAAAVDGAQAAASPLDELRARRDAKRGA
jgi:hypothetical protein